MVCCLGGTPLPTLTRSRQTLCRFTGSFDLESLSFYKLPKDFSSIKTSKTTDVLFTGTIQLAVMNKQTDLWIHFKHQRSQTKRMQYLANSNIDASGTQMFEARRSLRLGDLIQVTGTFEGDGFGFQVTAVQIIIPLSQQFTAARGLHMFKAHQLCRSSAVADRQSKQPSNSLANLHATQHDITPSTADSNSKQPYSPTSKRTDHHLDEPSSIGPAVDNIHSRRQHVTAHPATTTDASGISKDLAAEVTENSTTSISTCSQTVSTVPCPLENTAPGSSAPNPEPCEPKESDVHLLHENAPMDSTIPHPPTISSATDPPPSFVAELMDALSSARWEPSQEAGFQELDMHWTSDSSCVTGSAGGGKVLCESQTGLICKVCFLRI